MSTAPAGFLSLHEAALRLAAECGSEAVHAAEVKLASAIAHGDLDASVKRWATEQWEGRQLPGNLNRLETRIDEAEFAAWMARRPG